jgi:hypothetical protein
VQLPGRLGRRPPPLPRRPGESRLWVEVLLLLPMLLVGGLLGARSAAVSAPRDAATQCHALCASPLAPTRSRQGGPGQTHCGRKCISYCHGRFDPLARAAHGARVALIACFTLGTSSRDKNCLLL